MFFRVSSCLLPESAFRDMQSALAPKKTHDCSFPPRHGRCNQLLWEISSWLQRPILSRMQSAPALELIMVAPSVLGEKLADCPSPKAMVVGAVPSSQVRMHKRSMNPREHASLIGLSRIDCHNRTCSICPTPKKQLVAPSILCKTYAACPNFNRYPCLH